MLLGEVERLTGYRLLTPLEARRKKLAAQFADRLARVGTNSPTTQDYFGYPVGPKILSALWETETPSAEPQSSQRPAWALRLDILLEEWFSGKCQTDELLRRLDDFQRELQTPHDRDQLESPESSIITAIERLKAIFGSPNDLEMLQLYSNVLCLAEKSTKFTSN